MSCELWSGKKGISSEFVKATNRMRMRWLWFPGDSEIVFCQKNGLLSKVHVSYLNRSNSYRKEFEGPTNHTSPHHGVQNFWVLPCQHFKNGPSFEVLILKKQNTGCAQDTLPESNSSPLKIHGR